MDSKKYIGMDVHKESISIAVMNGAGKIGMECLIETKASTILQFIDGLRGDVQVTFVGVGLFPQRQKILVRPARLRRVPLQHIGAAQSKMRQCSQWGIQNNGAVVQ